ncbi:MAG: metallophosphoesterase family protein [Rhodospirillales bacterium]
MSVRLAHLSDLHFGKIQEPLLQGLLQDLRRARPDLAIVSGDLTQRARRQEFRAARRFLDSLPCDWLAVPGNHDVPAYNLYSRFFRPYRRYKRWISASLMPTWQAKGVVVVGVNSARRAGLTLNWADGRVSKTQMEAAVRRLTADPDATHRILVAHHPFLKLAESDLKQGLVGRHEMATQRLRAAEVDLILAGHLHRSYHGQLDLDEAGNRLFVVQAGTATSTRTRGQANAYHLLDLAPGRMTVQSKAWAAGRFHPDQEMRLAQGNDRQWRVVAGEEPEVLELT